MNVLVHTNKQFAELTVILKFPVDLITSES